MKKVWTAVFVGASAATLAIYLAGYEYIFKAVAINLKKGALTPSIDDEDKFPSLLIEHLHPNTWEKHIRYNSTNLSDKILKDLEKTRASSLLIIKDNKLIHEQYWKDHSSCSLMNSFSMAKGVLSILVGFAIDDGFLISENQLISSLFPKYKDNRYGKHLTIKHLMTMQGGLDWKEEYRHPFAENSKQYFVNDLAKQVFETDFKEKPGQKYDYQSIAAQLLGLVLRKAVGKSLASYLSDKLWKPLGMEYSAKWSTDEQGVEKAFCCIHATARDFAKLGQFIMQEGNWNGDQLLSKKFCKEILTPTKQNDAFCSNIWANDEGEIKYRFFYGFLGQFIVMIPEKNMVIVKTGLHNRLDVDQKKRPLQVALLVKELSII